MAWLRCALGSHDLGMQLLQAAQVLEMASYSWWSSSTEDRPQVERQRIPLGPFGMVDFTVDY